MTKRKTTEEFIAEAKAVHGDKYDYSKVEYKYALEKVCIICPTHGEFWQKPNDHLQGHGCPHCKVTLLAKSKCKTTKDFISEAKKVHGDKYDYSKVEYKNNTSKVCIICPIHGEFWQSPKLHLKGCGCAYCSGKHKPSKEEFIEKARKIHGNKYDYSKVEYINNSTKVCIICPKHGEFWQNPHSHIDSEQGCPVCNESHLEMNIRNFLVKNDIDFKPQKHFDWLGQQSLDFYLPKYNIAIECQGKQHFEKGGWKRSHIGLLKQYVVIKDRDTRKRKLCEENGVKLLYFADKEYNNADYEIFIDKNSLLKAIIGNET